ncbi:MAG TPA: hypothetical protein VMF03_04945, partial [Steroidobacteraceae bacterium]|nr:hypothetical protein [Steroidobacteraceae bacterium]
KQRFESILAYKQAHVDDFGKLQVDNSFQALFSNLEPLVAAFVGTNEIRLRRACAIKDKGLKNAWLALMPRLWATTATEAPGRMDSSTISRFSA